MRGAAPVADRYRRLRLLGEGAASRVWLVDDALRPGEPVALKEPQPGADQETLDHLRLEFVSLARLRHPGLVEVYDFDRGPDSALARFSLEVVTGQDIVSFAGAAGPGPLPQLAAEALTTLGFLHDFGLFHRDLKPAHLVVRDRPRQGNRTALLDLGLASGASSVGEPAGPVGTLPFIAPELFENPAPTCRSDLYSLGAVFYNALFGVPPHKPRGDDLRSFIEAARQGPAELPEPEGAPAGFSRWLFETLSPDPALRPTGATEALARLNTLTGNDYPSDSPAIRAARLDADPPPGRLAACRDLEKELAHAGPRLIWLTGAAGSGKSRMLRWLETEAILGDWNVLPRNTELSATFAANQPDRSLFLLDDVQNAEDRLAPWLDRLARQSGSPAIHVVAAVRPGELSDPRTRRLFEDTETVPTLGRVDLAPMGLSELRELLRRGTGARSDSETRTRWLARTSEGNALLAEALVVEGAWERGGEARRSVLLERSVSTLLDLATGPARRWLESLVILGRDTPSELIAELSGLSQEESREAAEQSRRAGLAPLDRRSLVPGLRLGRGAGLPGNRSGARSGALPARGGDLDPLRRSGRRRMAHGASVARRRGNGPRRRKRRTGGGGSPVARCAFGRGTLGLRPRPLPPT